MDVMDLRGLNPAPVTLFKADGSVDFDANAELAKWLVSVEGVKSLVILGHAGEGTFLTEDERLEMIRVYKDAVGHKVPIITGIVGEGTEGEEGRLPVDGCGVAEEFHGGDKPFP